MSVMLRFTESAPMVAYIPGALIAFGVVLGVALAIYAVWWLVFKMGK